MQSDWSRRVQYYLYCALNPNIVLSQENQQRSNSVVELSRNLLMKEELIIIKKYIFTCNLLLID